MAAHDNSRDLGPSSSLRLPFPFRNTFVLNLNGDDGRWRNFLAKNHWITKAERLVRVPLPSTDRVSPPKFWRSSSEEWARSRGILRLVEECLNQQIPSGMLLEDDMVLAPQGHENFRKFADDIPFDWHWMVLAGQHINLTQGVPTSVGENAFRPYSLAGCSAFGWRTFPAIRRLYDHYLAVSGGWPVSPDFFTDNAHNSRCSYVPGNWVFRKEPSDGPSDVVNTIDLCSRKSSHGVVAVLGAYRGGTSCVAGVLHHLGVRMGDDLAPADSINPTGYFECQRLLDLCKHIVDHPSLSRRFSGEQISGLLRQWAYQRSLSAKRDGYLGAKHPVLCCLEEEMQAAWGDAKFVVVDRPVDQVLNSIQRTGWGWSREEASIATHIVLSQREELLRNCDSSRFVRVDFQELCRNPSDVVQRLQNWLSLPASESQIRAAVGHVQLPERRR